MEGGVQGAASASGRGHSGLSASPTVGPHAAEELHLRDADALCVIPLLTGCKPCSDPAAEVQIIPLDIEGSDAERRQRHNVIASSIIGNLLEWYDFLVFAYQSVVISKLFFPASDSATRLLAVYGIFAAGFMTRPLGALFFGWVGDRYSRKTALLASIYLMSVPTTLMGCLPTYSQVGLLAPWLLVLTRIAQGFAVGGEFTATMVFLVEHAPPGEAGLQGSWAFFSVMIGVLAGSGVSVLFNYALTDAQLYSWGWRIPFLLSVVGAGVGAYMRRNVHEPPMQHSLLDHHGQQGPGHAHAAGSGAERAGGASPQRTAPTEAGGGESGGSCQGQAATDGSTRIDGRRVSAGGSRWVQALLRSVRSPAGLAVQGGVTVFMIDCMTAIGFYLVVIFMPVYFQEFVGLSRKQAISIHTLNMVLYMVLVPVGGILSDRIGRRAVLALPALLVTLLAWPLWALLSTKGSVVAAFEGQAVLCILMALFSGTLPAAFAALFHPQYRCTGLALGHNMSMTLLGGTAPLVATALIRLTGSGMAPAVMLMVSGIGTMVGVAMAQHLFGMS